MPVSPPAGVPQGLPKMLPDCGAGEVVGVMRLRAAFLAGRLAVLRLACFLADLAAPFFEPFFCAVLGDFLATLPFDAFFLVVAFFADFFAAFFLAMGEPRYK